MAPSRRATKKWELFAGRNKFYCDGFLMTAPNSSIFYLTVVLITGTSGLFFAFDCPFLAEKITPAIPIVGGILYIFTMCALFRTSFSDPGIIPRASQDEAAYIEKQIEVPNALNSPTYRPPPRTKEVFVRGQTVKLKYCFTCKIFRPPRASHCSLCDNCVDRFDHHCPWVGNCVGRRNYRFFYMFIVSLAFLAVFIFACAITHLVLLQAESRDLLEVIKITPFSVVVSAICFLSVWSVIGLAGFHTYLTTSDQTTNEDIKGSFSTKSGQASSNPYSHGNICLNCFYILCGPLQPSLIDRRGVVTEEFRIQMQTQDKFNGMPSVPPMVVQPLSSGIDPMGKSYSNLEMESQNSNNTLAGVYRQRSYDNLQNDKSTSVSHLVENELPLASVISPSSSTIDKRALRASQSSMSDLQIHSMTDMSPDDELAMSGSGADIKSNNTVNGSYNNLLFRENSSNLSSAINDVDIQRRKSGNYGEMAPSASAILNDKMTENVYSNIPNSVPTPTSPPIPNLLKAGATDHVYSNIDETISRGKVGGGGGYMSDSLDLDDPLLSSSFIKKKEKPNNNNQHNNIYNTTAVVTSHNETNKVLPSISSSSSTAGTQITSIELKNVLNVALQKSQVTPKTNDATKAAQGSSVAVHTANRQETMIDTALDLDSLDGSSIGNNSQSCLVSSKTAIV